MTTLFILSLITGQKLPESSRLAVSVALLGFGETEIEDVINRDA
jgi:hypothetical protein